jgi:hypothetical protein
VWTSGSDLLSLGSGLIAATQGKSNGMLSHSHGKATPSPVMPISTALVMYI